MVDSSSNVYVRLPAALSRVRCSLSVIRLAAKLFHAEALFDFSLGEARLAFIAHAGFNEIKIVVQILQFIAQGGNLLAFAGDGADDSAFSGLSHKRLFGYRFCG